MLRRCAFLGQPTADISPSDGPTRGAVIFGMAGHRPDSRRGGQRDLVGRRSRLGVRAAADGCCSASDRWSFPPVPCNRFHADATRAVRPPVRPARLISQSGSSWKVSRDSGGSRRPPPGVCRCCARSLGSSVRRHTAGAGAAPLAGLRCGLIRSSPRRRPGRRGPGAAVVGEAAAAPFGSCVDDCAGRQCRRRPVSCETKKGDPLDACPERHARVTMDSCPLARAVSLAASPDRAVGSAVRRRATHGCPGRLQSVSARWTPGWPGQGDLAYQLLETGQRGEDRHRSRRPAHEVVRGLGDAQGHGDGGEHQDHAPGVQGPAPVQRVAQNGQRRHQPGAEDQKRPPGDDAAGGGACGDEQKWIVSNHPTEHADRRRDDGHHCASAVTESEQLVLVSCSRPAMARGRGLDRWQLCGDLRQVFLMRSRIRRFPAACCRNSGLLRLDSITQYKGQLFSRIPV